MKVRNTKQSISNIKLDSVYLFACLPQLLTLSSVLGYLVHLLNICVVIVVQSTSQLRKLDPTRVQTSHGSPLVVYQKTATAALEKFKDAAAIVEIRCNHSRVETHRLHVGSV